MPQQLYILGLLFEGNDPSACLIQGNTILAFAEEERFTRNKHAPNAFPVKAVDYCLSSAGITIEDVAVISIGWDADKFPIAMAEFYLKTWHRYGSLGDHVLQWQIKQLPRYTREHLMKQVEDNLLRQLPPDKYPAIEFTGHHFAHACSAALLSGFDSCSVITADGHGEDDCTNIYKYENNEITLLQTWQLPHSLGWFYTKFTEWFGFSAHDGEGKLMGLAAYGEYQKEYFDKVGKVIRLTGEDNVYEVEPAFFYGQYAEGLKYTDEWLELFGKPLAGGHDYKFSQQEKDLAFAVQSIFENIGKQLLKRAVELTGLTNVAVAGGSFMNCKLNGLLAKETGYDKFFAQPAAGDNGIALGAALAAAYKRGIRSFDKLLSMAYGPEYSNEEIEKSLKKAGLTYTFVEDIEKRSAEFIAESKVIGWFQGRMETGARALGKRSILANPADPEISNLVNRKVKFREEWRPFCPSAASEDASKYFTMDKDLPFMIVACEARPAVNEKLPSVVHIDNTVRVQTVREDIDPRYYRLLKEVEKLTGYAVVLNTSFNIKGEPIVNTPDDAVKTFLNTSIDVLAIGSYLVTEKPEKGE